MGKFSHQKLSLLTYTFYSLYLYDCGNKITAFKKNKIYWPFFSQYTVSLRSSSVSESFWWFWAVILDFSLELLFVLPSRKNNKKVSRVLLYLWIQWIQNPNNVLNTRKNGFGLQVYDTLFWNNNRCMLNEKSSSKFAIFIGMVNFLKHFLLKSDFYQAKTS